MNDIKAGNLVRVSSMFRGNRWLIVSKVNEKSILVNVSGIVNVGKRVPKSEIVELDTRINGLCTWESIFGEPYKA